MPQLARINNGSLELIPATLERVIRHLPRNVRWIATFGVARSGKSSLMNFLSNSRCFDVSGSTEPCTNGIWISEPIYSVDRNDCVVYLDSEGTEVGDTSFLHKLLALVCLITCDGGVLIQNELHFGESFLKSLEHLVFARNIVRGAPSSSWPHLCIFFRNFNLRMHVNRRPCTNAEFLENLLSPQQTSADHNQYRSVIKQSFVNRSLHTSPEPNVEIADPLNIPPSPFRTALEELRNKVLAAATPKTISGEFCDGRVMAEFLQACVTKINEEGELSLVSTVEMTFNRICARVAEESFRVYKTRMEEVAANPTGDAARLAEVHRAARAAATDAYAVGTQSLYRPCVERFHGALTHRIDNDYLFLQACNERVRVENDRAEAERLRETAEALRVQEERRRQEADENARIAEQRRIEEEVARQAAQEQQRHAEHARQLAEAQLQLAEAGRQTAQQEVSRAHEQLQTAVRALEASQQRLQHAEAEFKQALTRKPKTYFSFLHGWMIDGVRVW